MILATNYASASYQEILDVNTVKGNVTVIGIHTPTGSTPVRRLSGFFTQFRKFKYRGCIVQVVPAATLPADPLQVGFEAGENTIDMRDMLNPILFMVPMVNLYRLLGIIFLSTLIGTMVALLVIRVIAQVLVSMRRI